MLVEEKWQFNGSYHGSNYLFYKNKAYKHIQAQIWENLKHVLNILPSLRGRSSIRPLMQMTKSYFLPMKC